MNTINENSQAIANFEMAKKKTNHILHLILSVLTVGCWVLIWVLIAVSHSLENYQLEKRMLGTAPFPWGGAIGALVVLYVWGTIVYTFTSVAT